MLDAKVKQEFKQDGSKLCLSLYINFAKLRLYKSLHYNIFNWANSGAECSWLPAFEITRTARFCRISNLLHFDGKLPHVKIK